MGLKQILELGNWHIYAFFVCVCAAWLTALKSVNKGSLGIRKELWTARKNPENEVCGKEKKTQQHKKTPANQDPDYPQPSVIHSENVTCNLVHGIKTKSFT